MLAASETTRPRNTTTGSHFCVLQSATFSPFRGASCSVFTIITFHTLTQMSSLRMCAMSSDLRSAWPMAICSRFPFLCIYAVVGDQPWGRFPMPETQRPATCCATRARDSCRFTIYTSRRTAVLRNHGNYTEMWQEENRLQLQRWRTYSSCENPAPRFYGNWACDPVTGRRRG